MLLVRSPRKPGMRPAAFVGPLLLLACGFAGSARPTRAQEARSVQHLEIAFLAGRTDERDATISPLRYDGMLAGGRLAYSAGGPRRFAELGVWMTAGNLSAERGEGARDRSAVGIGFSIVQRLSSTTMLGLAVEGEAAEAIHHYRSAGVSERFEMTLVSLAPMLDWTPERSRGRLRLRVAMPVVALVAHPYTRARVVEDPSWRVAGPARWLAPSLEMRYTSSETRRLALRAAYRLDVRRLRDDVGVSHVDNRLTLAALVRMGSRR